MFLTDKEIAELTGIKRGCNGFTRAQLQCKHLRENGIKFFTNTRGEPKIPKAFIEGGQQTTTNAWQPRILQKTA